jgi:hypothetical protein
MALETPTQVPVTTAPFAGGSIPGLGGGQVPGIPSPGGSPAPQTGDPNDKAKQILAAILQAASRKQVANTAVPSPIPAGGDVESARNIGMNTGNPHAWGTQRFLATLGASIKNGIKAQKEAQLANAEGKWTYLQAALNELYNAQQSGDQRAVAVAQKKVDSITMDKDLKKMAKALNQDWLNPEKTDVWKQALDNVTKKQLAADQTNAQKEQAASGLKRMFQHLIQKAQGGPKPRLTDEQRQAMGREIQEKAPTVGATPDDQHKAALAALDIAKAEKDLQENYYPPTAGADGILRSVSKTDPHKVVTIRDSESGDVVKGIPKGPAPKPLVANGMPYGIARNGQILTPASADWTKEDQNVLDSAREAAKEKQQLRINPIIADQLGEPPNPTDFSKGRSDPKYAAALKEYGIEGEKIQERMSAASGYARAKAFNDFKVVEVTDTDANGDPVTHYTYGKDAISRGLSSAAQGGKNLSRIKQIEDIEFASNKFKETIKNVDKPFSVEQIAILTKALQAPDETIANAELQALANQNLTDSQFQLTLWIKQINERALSMRNIAGMGQGAQDTRNAIRGTLPYIGIGDKKRMLEAIAPFDNQVKILKSGIPKAGGGVGEGGDMEKQEHEGHTYQRKKGSNDPWVLAPSPKTN